MKILYALIFLHSFPFSFLKWKHFQTLTEKGFTIILVPFLMKFDLPMIDILLRWRFAWLNGHMNI